MNRILHRLGRLLVSIALALLAAAWAQAHPAPGSQVLLDVDPQALLAEIRIPLPELALAFGAALADSPAQAVALHAPALRLYLHRHLQVTAPDGRAWQVALGAVRADTTQQPAELVVASHWWPPPGAPLRRFTLTFDAVAHEVPNHAAVVSLRRDWASGQLGEEARILGTLGFNRHALALDLGPGSDVAGLRAVGAMGMQHIAAGTDHVLFLLVLLLPAPLAAGAAGWGAYRGARRSLAALFKIVTAFTLGHSLTLALGALGWVRLPAAPVEIVIALSILVSAVHAWRPLFAGREMFVAAGFGLVHGLAFAGAVAEMGLSGSRLVQAVLAFNLGIELMQLVIVALVFPLLWCMARTSCYPAVRRLLAAAAAVAAGAWMLERITGTPNVVAQRLQVLADRPLAAWAVLAAVALAVAALSRLRPPAPAAAKG